MDAKELGLKIALARAAANLTQAELAARVGVAQPRIAEYEKGVHVPSALKLARIEAALATVPPPN